MLNENVVGVTVGVGVGVGVDVDVDVDVDVTVGVAVDAVDAGVGDTAGSAGVAAVEG